MQPNNIDVSVLMLFHARDDNFSQVWAEVKKARPARLFLYQDGPRMVDREGNAVSDPEQSKDWRGIMACRRLVCDEAIDWQCEVHRLYQEKNFGCDPSEYLSQRWAFSLTDKCIVLEDDDVPSQSFFPFCKEMLDRYEHDERVTLISGFNTDEVTADCDADYFFTRAFSIWGWASWARVVNNWDGDYGFVKDREQYDTLCRIVRERNAYTWMPDVCRQRCASGKEYYESIFWAYMTLHNGMAVMPRKNMINNIGLSGGTHYETELKLLPHRQRRLFTMQRHELLPPYRHPHEVSDSEAYLDRYLCRMGLDRPLHKLLNSIEELLLNLRHGRINNITAAIKKRVAH